MRLTKEYLSHIDIKSSFPFLSNSFFVLINNKMSIRLKKDLSLLPIIRKFLDASSTEWVNNKICISFGKIVSCFSIGATAKLYPCYNITLTIEVFFGITEVNTASDSSPVQRNIVKCLHQPINHTLHTIVFFSLLYFCFFIKNMSLNH